MTEEQINKEPINFSTRDALKIICQHLEYEMSQVIANKSGKEELENKYKELLKQLETLDNIVKTRVWPSIVDQYEEACRSGGE